MTGTHMQSNNLATTPGIATRTGIRVVVVDDHALVRQGIILLINSQPDMKVVGQAEDGESAYRLVRQLMPDVVVMDVSMPGVGGAVSTERIKAVCPTMKVLALSAYQDDVYVRQLRDSGAVGYVFKKAVAEELTRAIRKVMRGETCFDEGYLEREAKASGDASSEASLSVRERQILSLTASGHTNKEIAANLHLSVKTVEGHKTRVMDKLGFANRAQLVQYALQNGLLK